MTAKKILQRESPILRKIAEAVKIEDITSPRIKKILVEMKESLESQEDGVAIAAPQIGYALRIFVVSKKVANLKRKNEDVSTTTDQNNDLVFINPVVKKVSKEKKTVEEGCLSVRYLYGKVSRSHKATVEAYNESGKKFTRGGTGLLAQIFQHEIDHLNGILFIDKAKNVEEILPEEADPEKKHERS